MKREPTLRLFTIGGYGFTEMSFREALSNAGIDTFVDIRQRRGVRGGSHAFLNSQRLQQLLASKGIRYVYAPELAPTSTIRAAQQEVDRTLGIAKRDRTKLSSDFVRLYTDGVLAHFDAEEFGRRIRDAHVVVLFCVERLPSACHRSLAAERLSQVFHSCAPVGNIVP